MDDKILATIIKHEMSIPDGRIVLYDQNYKAPKDNAIYIVIKTGEDKITSSTNKLDTATNEQIQTLSMNTNYDIEITSKDNSAKERRHEILMALNSNYAIRKMEENNIRIFKISKILDLSFIEASSSLHRFKISVIINSMKIKKSSTDYYDKFQSVEVEINE